VAVIRRISRICQNPALLGFLFCRGGLAARGFTSNAEVSTRFDNKRLTELPLVPNRNVLNVALSAAAVSQLGAGQSNFAQDTNFSVNGMRLRSNNFMLDVRTATTRA
jgi:hypothetical protein